MLLLLLLVLSLLMVDRKHIMIFSCLVKVQVGVSVDQRICRMKAIVSWLVGCWGDVINDHSGGMGLFGCCD